MSGRADEDRNEPVIQLEDAGIWFHLHRRTKINLRQAILRRQLLHKPARLWALRHLNLKLYDGQVLGIIGPNGAGKSTLCLVLSQILPLDEGSVTVRGKVSQLVGLNTGMQQDLSGRANVRLMAAYLGIPKDEIESKMQEIIDFSELGHFIDEPMRHYSSGMKGRLGFSVATALQPDILLLDEVFSVGDARFRIKSKRRIEEMMARCRLIAVVSHSTEFLRELCTDCLWIDQGRVVRLGKTADVIDEYEEVMGPGSSPLDPIPE